MHCVAVDHRLCRLVHYMCCAVNKPTQRLCTQFLACLLVLESMVFVSVFRAALSITLIPADGHSISVTDIGRDAAPLVVLLCIIGCARVLFVTTFFMPVIDGATCGFMRSLVPVISTVAVFVQLSWKQRSSVFTGLVTAGFKATQHSFLFDSVLLLRKCGLVLLSFLMHDAFMSALAALLMSVVLWMVLLAWKPYVPTHHDMLARLAHTVVFLLQVRLYPCARRRGIGAAARRGHDCRFTMCGVFVRACSW